MILDTHKAVEKLIAAGNKKENAEAIVEIISSQSDNLSTKHDIKLLEGTISQVETILRTEINELKSELKEDIANLKTEFKGDIFALKGEIIEMKNNFKWVMALMFVMLGLLVKIAFFG